MSLKVTSQQPLLYILIFVFMGVLCSCASKQPQEIDPTNLKQLESLSNYEKPTAEPLFNTTQIRAKAIQDTALGLGAQGGLAYASELVNKRLERDKWYLETIYNFNGMMLSHGVLPPVLVEGDNSLNLADPNTIRIADKTYKIVAQARFATTPPNWREYLEMHFAKPEIPHKFLMPRNDYEQGIWKKYINIGWQKGIEQAASIFQQSLARLKRDYKGMILYRTLLQKNMVSAPYVSTTELGVTGDGNDMRINDQVLRITELPKLQTDSSGWKAIVVKEHG